MLTAMPFVTNGGRQVDDSFDQFSLLEVGHGLITPLELRTSQSITRFEG
jgi:hypothetical protein